MQKLNRKDIISTMMQKLIKYSSSVSKYGQGEFDSDEEDYFRGNCERAYDTGIMDGKADAAEEILQFIKDLNLDPVYTKKERQKERDAHVKAKKEEARLKKLNSPAAKKKAEREKEKQEKKIKRDEEKQKREQEKKEKLLAKENDPKNIERKKNDARKGELKIIKDALLVEKENKRKYRLEKVEVSNKLKTETDSIEKKKLKHVLNAVKAKIAEVDKNIKKLVEKIKEYKSSTVVKEVIPTLKENITDVSFDDVEIIADDSYYTSNIEFRADIDVEEDEFEKV